VSAASQATAADAAGAGVLARPVVDRRDVAGRVLSRVALDPAVFGVVPNPALMHQVVTGLLASRRAGTQSTRTRAEVSGGGAKPYRQKGTGRARQGSIRAPHYRGGGIALGPKPRSHAKRTPRRMVAAALRGALSDRAAAGRVAVVDRWPFEVPRTKAAVAALGALGLSGRVLVVHPSDDDAVARSFRNLSHVLVRSGPELDAYDVLRADWVVFSDETLPGETEEVEVLSSTEPASEAPLAEAPVGAEGEEPAEADGAAEGEEPAEADGAAEGEEPAEADGAAEGEEPAEADGGEQ